MISFIQQRRVHYLYTHRYYIRCWSYYTRIWYRTGKKIVRSIVFSTRDYAFLVKIIISFAVWVFIDNNYRVAGSIKPRTRKCYYYVVSEERSLRWERSYIHTYTHIHTHTEDTLRSNYYIRTWNNFLSSAGPPPPRYYELPTVLWAQLTVWL